MKRILTLLIFLKCFTTEGQTPADEDYKFNYWSNLMRQVYEIDIAQYDIDSYQQKLYELMYVNCKQNPLKEINFQVIAKGINLKVEQIDSLLMMMDPSLNKSPYKASAVLTKAKIKIVETGKLFPELILIDTSGKASLVKDYRGKFVFIDFWSSWCSPCRKQIPDLKKVYNKYNKIGFEIIGISMDGDKTAWLKSIKDDKQNWVHYCDLNGFENSRYGKQFLINTIPVNFLLDNNGIVLGQDLSPGQVEEILKVKLKN